MLTRVILLQNFLQYQEKAYNHCTKNADTNIFEQNKNNP